MSRGEQTRIRDWTVSLYYLPRCPSARADRSGWYVYAEHASGARVPPNPLPWSSHESARAAFNGLLEIVR